MNKRSDWEIYLAILNALEKMKTNQEDIYKTNIMHHVHMNWKSFNKHFKKLEQKEFIEKNKENYQITKKGKKLHQTLKKLQQLLNVPKNKKNQK